MNQKRIELNITVNIHPVMEDGEQKTNKFIKHMVTTGLKNVAKEIEEITGKLENSITQWDEREE